MWEFITFEINYRLKRPVTYIYFALLFAMSFLAVTTDIVRAGGSGGKVMENAPLVVVALMLFIMIFGIFIASAIMGVPVLRDFEHRTNSIIFTTPTSKFNYLVGKFLGSFFILVLVISGIVWGMMLGQYLPWPWLDNADKLLPFDSMAYFQPFLIFVLPNLFAFGAIFFAGGTIGKRMVTVYAQGIILFMGYLVAQQFLAELDNQELAGLIDPFGFGAMSVTTQYWTVVEQNSQLITFEGIVLANRLIWMGIGLGALILTYFTFSFSQSGAGSTRKKKTIQKQALENAEKLVVPEAQQLYGPGAQWVQIRSLSWFYFKWIVKQGPFIYITLAGIIFIFIIAFASGTTGYDIDLYITSSRAVQLIGIFNLFFIIIIVFYTGEIIWKERDVKMSLIYDALPYRNFVSLAGKFFGMVLMCIFLLVVLMFCGILIQLIKGFPAIEWNIYFTSLFADTLAVMVLYLMLGIFIQAAVNHKFIGFGLMFLFYISMLVMNELGIEHTMFYFARASLGQYSEMNEFGHYVTPFSWFNIYWFGLAGVLFGLGILFTVRGLESKLVTRLKLGKLRLNRMAVLSISGALLVFVLSGSFIYYNTNVLNRYRNSELTEKLQAEYERALKQYQFLNQPKITASFLEVALYPQTRDFTAKGSYVLKNKSDEPIADIHIQTSPDAQVETEVEFDRGTVVKQSFEAYNYTIYQLSEALNPGDSLKMSFAVSFITRGFKESGSNTDVIYNGTFFNNTQYFPSLGYDEGYELLSDDDRKDNDLEEKERMLERDDPNGIANSLFGDDADKIAFEIVVSTDSSQIAIAPGYLQKTWLEGDREYFHYKMDAPMVNFYSVVSADYEVKTDRWLPPADTLPEVALEIYYHKGHEYNLDRMMKGMKEALSYYTENFSPYQFRQLRIMEFPRYRSFAQSFANTVPFSEGIGFIQHIKDDDVDLPFYVTAHEVAHQWWGHQVTEAGVRGNAMLSETLSQYSALMVMKKNFPPEIISEFLRHELDSYLGGRTFERKKEMPLELVEGQGYIHYRKGSLIMYALQDYIGEDSVNAALKRFVQDWGFKEAPYPTSRDLIGYYRQVTPDSLQYIIGDMFETITLFENKATKAEYEQLDSTRYKVSLTIDAIKYRADSLGNEESVPLKDWIDVGVFAKGSNDKDSLIYLKKYKFTQQETNIEIEVDAEPFKAGIDPINKLIDRNPQDNLKEVEEKENAA